MQGREDITPALIPPHGRHVAEPALLLSFPRGQLFLALTLEASSPEDRPSPLPTTRASSTVLPVLSTEPDFLSVAIGVRLSHVPRVPQPAEGRASSLYLLDNYKTPKSYPDQGHR